MIRWSKNIHYTNAMVAMACMAALSLAPTSLSPISVTSKSNAGSLVVGRLWMPKRTAFFPKVFAISTNDFRTGTEIEVDGAPWRVLEFLHVKPGKGAAFVRTKLKNYLTGNTVEKTFRAGESVDEARVEKEVKQFTYKDGEQYVFMDMVTYEELRLNESDIKEKSKWLLEGMECNVLTWNGRVIDVDLPITVKMKVIQADPGVKGDTAQGGGSKPATVETGAVVYVPLFVSEGQQILIDTRTGTYMSRA